MEFRRQPLHDIIIVGGGPAGLTAAIYALRAGKTALVIEKSGFGGQIAFSPKVENIPGTAQISGAAFADSLTEQAMNLGADVELENVVSVNKAGDVFTVTTEEGCAYESRAVIIAVGVKHRMLGLPGEADLIGSGISFCAVCDGAFYTGQDVAMVGGGNSALQEALLLSEVCHKVTVVQNLPFLTGEKLLADALAEKENVEILLGTVVSGYETESGALTGLSLHSETQGDSRIPVSGVFLAVGLEPQNEPFAHLTGTNPPGDFTAGEDCLTATPGGFVAGDCRQKAIRQVVTACADGAVAAMAACRYLD